MALSLQYGESKNLADSNRSIKVGPLEAILVIFGLRALIFFCLKALAKK